MDYISFKCYTDCTSFKFIELDLQDPCTGAQAFEANPPEALYLKNVKSFHRPSSLTSFHALESTNSSSTNHTGHVLTPRDMDGTPLKLEFDITW